MLFTVYQLFGDIWQSLQAVWRPLLFALDLWWVWLPLPAALLAWEAWRRYTRLWYYWVRSDWVTIEIRIPIEILKTPKAMEQVFSGVWSIITKGNRYERLWLGRWIDYMCFELVGMRGETHFFITMPEGYRPMVEALIYAQYPDAEIAQVEDFFESLPEKIPAPGWRFIGTELKFTAPDPYPIRTYIQFEDNVEERRIDPLANFAELFNKLQDGEYLFYQLLVRPMDYGEFFAVGRRLIERLIGRRVAPTPGSVTSAEVNAWAGTLFAGLRQFATGEEAVPAVETPERPTDVGTSLMLHLSPGERTAVEAIAQKLTKAPCEVDFRMAYLARQELYRPKAMLSGLFANTGLYGTGDVNGFRPHNATKTWVDYFKKWREPLREARLWHEMRKRHIVDYIFASHYRPSGIIVMNIEELASIWHFPITAVTTPFLPRIEAKKGEPPSGLPVG
ncbi:MAG: hypothetical protein Q8R13_04230 [bacterium]|nr:hypothetical protein [bacterium]MDZ4296487.1 hypothetical protein [Patescibacteria group bacterium]